MPPSVSETTIPVPRRMYLSSDDLLVRFMNLPEREQESVLTIFATAIEETEKVVVTRQRLIADARYGRRTKSRNDDASTRV